MMEDLVTMTPYFMWMIGVLQLESKMTSRRRQRKKKRISTSLMHSGQK